MGPFRFLILFSLALTFQTRSHLASAETLQFHSTRKLNGSTVGLALQWMFWNFITPSCRMAVGDSVASIQVTRPSGQIAD